MNVLGVNLGEVTSAALLCDGVVVAAAQEERFRRIKNICGFPVRAIQYCLEEAGIDLAQVDHVAMADLTDSGFLFTLVQRRSRFSVADYVREARAYWYPKLYLKRQPKYLEIFADKLDEEVFPRPFFEFWMKRYGEQLPTTEAEWQEVKRDLFLAYFPGYPRQRIGFYRHHLCHASHAFFSSPFCEEAGETLVCTADSFGDYDNAIVTKFTEGRPRVLEAISNHNLGRLYRNMTLLLGMKPYEHEYKVMGLAPYAPAWLAAQSQAVFDETLQNDGTTFRYKVQPPDNYFYFRDRLEGHRFDGIAGGLQAFFEDRIWRWVKNCAEAYGCRRIVFGGGLALNIKCNQRLAASDFLDDFFAAPAPDDSSNAIGAAELAYLTLGEGGARPRRLTSMNLGESVDHGSALRFLRGRYGGSGCTIQERASPEAIAQLLAKGWVVGRCVGRMEFGERALGNRSILADPRDRRIVDRMNRIIKQRDFWMPFAPVMLQERAGEYLVPSKARACEFMTVAFETKDAGVRQLPGALHPADHTTRPQVLTRAANPAYYDIVRAFHERTGVGALINTSFNLHGHPIVRTPEDAADIFDHSGMDALLCGDTLVMKHPTATIAQGSSADASLSEPTIRLAHV